MLYIAYAILILCILVNSIMSGNLFFAYTMSPSAYLGTHAAFVPYLSGIYISSAYNFNAYSMVDCMLA